MKCSAQLSKIDYAQKMSLAFHKSFGNFGEIMGI